MQEIVTKLILELQQNIADNAGTIDYERYEAELLSVLQNLQQCNVSGSLPPFPDWNEAIKGIDDSRFTALDGRYEVREGARIMYDRLYSMLSRRQ